jgi:hypothetical protein
MFETFFIVPSPGKALWNRSVQSSSYKNVYNTNGEEMECSHESLISDLPYNIAIHCI